MIFRHPLHILTLILTLFMCTVMLHSVAVAQESKEEGVQSLGDILNAPEDFGSNGQPLTSAIMANHYYGVCASKKNLAFDEEETKILCGCNAAKMSEVLTVQEFKDLDKNTKTGKKARGKALAYAYAPCMKYVTEKKVKDDCYVSNKLNDIVVGKRSLCKCVVDNFKYYFDHNATSIITRATHYDPMTMNPLEDYFIGADYSSQRGNFIKQCRFKFLYKRDNR